MTAATRILSADVGGTKTLLRVSSIVGEELATVREELVESAHFDSLGEMLSRFLADDEREIAAACFAVAGPADGNSAVVTNLGWHETADEIGQVSGIADVRLVNDFFAVAAGIPHLTDNDLVSLNGRVRFEAGPVAVLGAGTGLGEAVSVDAGGIRHILSSEGGHASFAPRSQVQRLLLEYLEEKFGHVSYERVLSGPGIVNIFTFYCERIFQVSVEEAGVLAGEAHKAARVASLAAQGHDIAFRTMETFVDIYGAEAGNLALKVLPTGGIYVCGGIAAKNVDWFLGERFLAAYADKGRMRDLLLEFPVDVVSNSKLGLIGATAVAADMVRRH